MKTNTLKSRKGLLLSKKNLVAFALFGYGITNAQVQNNSTIYVSDNTEFYVASGLFNFGATPAATQTTRTASVYGILSFNDVASWNNASDNHYINGYARKYGTSAFMFPVGDAGIYAPASVTASAASGVDCAYFRATPAQNNALAPTVSRISSDEFWAGQEKSAQLFLAQLEAPSCNGVILSQDS